MIPILFDKGETAFDSNGLGRLRDCIECKVTEGRNDIYECDFSYPVTGAHYNEITCGRIIGVTHDDNGDVQPFDIVSRNNTIDGIVEFHAVHISYRLLKLSAYPNYIYTLSGAINSLNLHTWPSSNFVFYTDIQNQGYIRLPIANGLPHSVREILGGGEGSILDIYGGELQFDGWNVNLLASRGTDRNYTIRYGVNLTDYSEEVDYSNSYNQVMPYWTDGTISVVGDVVTYSGANYLDRDECIPLDLSDRFESKPTKASLESLAQTIIDASDPVLPVQSITLSFVKLADSPEYTYLSNLQNFGLCDLVDVAFPIYGITGKYKIVKTVYNVLQDRFDEIELGALSMTLSDALGISEISASSSVGATIKIDSGISASSPAISSGSHENITVNFNTTFSTAPNVVGMLYNVMTNADAAINTHQLAIQLKSVTTTSATFDVMNNGSAIRKTLVSWVATGN